MSTPCVIGLAAGDGFENAVYCNSDGHPTSMGPTLFLLAERLGVAGAWEALDAAKRGGWSMIHPDRIEQIEAWEAEHGETWFSERIPTYLDDRGLWIDGVGYQHTDESDWREEWHGGEFDAAAYWAYAIDELRRTLSVFDLSNGHPKLVGGARFGDPDVDWARMECGSEFERCNHYAWFHFPEIDAACRLGTQQYLGREPLTVEDACGLVDKSGREWKLSGSGHREFKGSGYTERWFGSAKSGEERRDFHLWSDNGTDAPTPNPDLTFLYPATRTSAP